jgi:hypothetical protein
MATIQSKPYPGELATADQLRLLADEFREAADLLLERQGRRRAPLSRAPFRLSAIHAIELYLNAFLMHRGHAAGAALAAIARLSAPASHADRKV